MNCEMVKKGDLSELFDALEELSGPIGIIVFGPDRKSRDYVFLKIVKKIRSTPKYSGYSETLIPAWPTVVSRIGVGENIIVKMDSEASTEHGERHRLVLGLRNNGAKTVVGVYVKGDPDTSTTTVKERIMKLEKHPPTSDGLDLFATVY